MQSMNFRNKWVVVTGASSGLGLEMARILAAEHGANLVLLARRVDRMLALKSELESKHGVKVTVIQSDLSKTGEAGRVFDSITAEHDVYAAILNAAVTYFGRAVEQSDESFESMLSTNVTSLVELTNRFVPYLIKRGDDGGVMMVSSLAGGMPMPYQATYCGMKAFVTNFGRALAAEVEKENVSVTVFTPGGIATEMLNDTKAYKPGDVGVMAADECARSALDGFKNRKTVQVPGALNRIIAVTTRMAPPSLVASQVKRMFDGVVDKK